MTTNTEGLKPCPTCGTHSSVGEHREFSDSGDYFVLCSTMQSGCGMSTGHYEEPEYAVKAWNRRPTAQASEAIPDARAELRQRMLDETAYCDHRALSTMPVEPQQNHDDAIQPEAVDAPLAITGWLPIESAPKDGTALLLFYEGSSNEVPFIVGWYQQEDIWRSGWFADDAHGPLNEPSLWMPLPASPTQSMKGSE